MKSEPNSTDYLLIPNPIYDVVFRYLMEDNESAKIILSTFIGHPIEELNFEPQIFPYKLDTDDVTQNEEFSEKIKVCYLDFAATIVLPDGTKEVIIIELQKAKLPNDIFRFKRYLTKNFLRKFKKTAKDEKTGAITEIEVCYRIFPIFIFNFIIENEIKDLVLNINREKTGVFKKQKLTRDNDFIENISYDMLIVQLPYIKEVIENDIKDDEYRLKLYKLLKLFDQSQTTENSHRLQIFRKLFPGYLERIIQRLQSADSEHPEIEDQMNFEDEYIKPYRNSLNEIVVLKDIIVEKDQVISEKDQQIIKMLAVLKSLGMSNVEIAAKTGLSIDEIAKL